jgi:C-terminal peptidase prc
MLKRIGFVALLLGAFGAPQLHADELIGRPLIVAVGIDKYQDKQIKPRKHAEADAKALVDLFLSKEHLGADKDNVKLLLGANATRKNILDALHWLEKSAKKDDLVLFAYFGEGAPLGERSCYFAVDSTYVNRAKDAVASSEIQPIVANIHTERFVALIDVGFMGFDPGKEKAPEPSASNFYREYVDTSDDAKDHTASRVVFMAGAATKPSLDLAKHGVFAQALLNGLDGKADSDGYEADGNITIGELAKYMPKAVAELAQQQGKTKEEKEQKSGVYQGQSSDFVFAYNPEARAKALDVLKKFETLAKDKSLDMKVAEEGHNLLVRMPKLEAQQKLRRAYQKLADGKLELAAFNTERTDILQSMKIAEKESGKFAITVMRAAELVRESYYKKVAKEPLVEAAVKGLFTSVEEKIPSDLQERLDKVKELKDVDLLRLLTDARQRLGTREDLAKGQDITHALNAMLAKLDKHTGYIPPEVVRRFRDDTAGSFKGIGVQIRKNDARDQLQVITPIYGSPAHKAGLKAGDIITTIVADVDPQTGEAYDKPQIIPTKGMTTEDAVKKIAGKAGTKVKVIVEREGSAKPIEFTLIRSTIEVESVLGHKRNKDDKWTYVIDPENKICYIRLTQFSENTYGELEKVMKKLYSEGIKGFILDLRFNPGGLLDSSIKIADLFIDDGLIVTVKHRDGSETSYVGRSDGSYTTFPMVCLINSGSASASEIVSACLQDHGRAIIVGSRSFGKGSVQTIHGFDNKSIIKLTSSTFWRPTGRNLNRGNASQKEDDPAPWGVMPDPGFHLKLSTREENDLYDHLRDAEIIRAGPSSLKTEFRDRQLDMALDYLRGQIRTAARNQPTRDIENR